MRTLVHLSDLHFGRVDPALLAPLRAVVNEIDPDVVVVSGDLTQRARSAEFKQARAFLDTLPAPRIVVPGNHDIALHNLFTRFLHPLEKYRRYITSDLTPFHIDDEVAVLGVNTARSLTIKDGRINAAQIADLRARLCGLDTQIVKIIVTHHPFDLPEHYADQELVGRAALAMQTFADCGADVLLAGHMHVGHAGSTAMRYKIGDYAALVVQAGTATSTRGRGEANSFNVLRIDTSRIVIERRAWAAPQTAFAPAAVEVFERTANGWAALRTDPDGRV
jgi:3',5'-cyclic AMP phosphodiesterase CpdA